MVRQFMLMRPIMPVAFDGMQAFLILAVAFLAVLVCHNQLWKYTVKICVLIPAIANFASVIIPRIPDYLYGKIHYAETDGTAFDDLIGIDWFAPAFFFLMVGYILYLMARFAFSKGERSLDTGNSYVLFRSKKDRIHMLALILGDWRRGSCFIIHQGRWWGYAKKDGQFKARGLVKRGKLLADEYCLRIDSKIASELCAENNGKKFGVKNNCFTTIYLPAIIKSKLS